MFHLVIETQFCNCVSMTYQLYVNVSMIQCINFVTMGYENIYDFQVHAFLTNVSIKYAHKLSK